MRQINITVDNTTINSDNKLLYTLGDSYNGVELIIEFSNTAVVLDETVLTFELDTGKQLSASYNIHDNKLYYKVPTSILLVGNALFSIQYATDNDIIFTDIYTFTVDYLPEKPTYIKPKTITGYIEDGTDELFIDTSYLGASTNNKSTAVEITLGDDLRYFDNYYVHAYLPSNKKYISPPLLLLEDKLEWLVPYMVTKDSGTVKLQLVAYGTNNAIWKSSNKYPLRIEGSIDANEDDYYFNGDAIDDLYKKVSILANSQTISRVIQEFTSSEWIYDEENDLYKYHMNNINNLVLADIDFNGLVYKGTTASSTSVLVDFEYLVDDIVIAALEPFNGFIVYSYK